jgi:hypothetical protein
MAIVLRGVLLLTKADDERKKEERRLWYAKYLRV